MISLALTAMLADEGDEPGDGDGNGTGSGSTSRSRKVVPLRSAAGERVPLGPDPPELARPGVTELLQHLKLSREPLGLLKSGFRAIRYSVELREIRTRSDERQVHIAIGPNGSEIYLVQVDERVVNELDPRYLKDYRQGLTYLHKLFPRPSNILLFSKGHQALCYEYESVVEDWRDEGRYAEFISWSHVLALGKSRQRVDAMARLLRKSRSASVPTAEFPPYYGEEAPMSDVTKRHVFVCYSHADARWRKRLETHLAPLVRDDLIDLWDDTKIKPGQDWKKEITNALAAARIAILLVSPDFLASKFIRDVELPTLLAAAEERGTKIMSIIVAPSLFLETPSISRFQAFNSPDNPLSGMRQNDRDRLLLSVAHEISYAIAS